MPTETPSMSEQAADRQEKDASAKETRVGRIAIVGGPNVGKSTLLNMLLGEPIAITSATPQTTRDRIAGVLTEGRTQFVFVDTPGLHRAKTRLGTHMNREAYGALVEADVVLLVTDVPVDDDVQVRERDRAIALDLPRDVPALVVINKVDKLKDKARLLPLIEAYAALRRFDAIIPLSARTADGRSNLLDELRKRLPVGPLQFEDDELSDKPLRFFAAEFVREQILRHTRHEVPHGVAVVVERFEDSGRVPHIELAIHVEKESHKPIVIGVRGSVLKAVGTAARARFEALLGKQVHLRLWVRVTPGWYEDEAKLRELGYFEVKEKKAGKP